MKIYNICKVFKFRKLLNLKVNKASDTSLQGQNACNFISCYLKTLVNLSSCQLVTCKLSLRNLSKEILYLTGGWAARCLAGLCLAGSVLTSCINEDLSGCGKNYMIVYRILVKADVTKAVEEELEGKVPVSVIDTLETILAPAFESKISDMTFAFFNRLGKAEKIGSHIVDNEYYKVVFYLPPDGYTLYSSSFDKEKNLFAVAGEESPHIYKLGYSSSSDTIETVMTNLFSVKAQLELTADTADVIMPQLNSAIALVLKPRSGKPLGEASAFVRNTASHFLHSDSTFVFDGKLPVIHADRADKDGITAFCAVSLPSPEVSTTKSDDDVHSSYWEMDVYIKVDDKITKNVLYMETPLRAGEPEVIYLEVNDNGEVVEGPEVAVSVELDWKPGLDFELDVEI